MNESDHPRFGALTGRVSYAAPLPAALRKQADELRDRVFELENQATEQERREQEREAATRERAARRALAIATLTAVAEDPDAPALSRIEAARQLVEIA